MYAERISVPMGEHPMRYRWFAASILAAGAVVTLTACGSNSTTPPASSATTPPAASSTGTTSSSANPTGSGIKTVSTSLGTVLVDSQGYVLYWFAPDTSTASNCNGSCASYWPPVIGAPTAASGVSLPGKLGTITRQDGQVQATYDGHPLYTYLADKSAGQATGNNVNASGGLWYAMTPSGDKASASSGSGGSSTPSSGASSGGSGGYGY
jgi:predicted lipoprotein with Yx(FWY)xxD motif